MMREVVFYRTVSGGCPVQEFLDTLSSKQAQKAAWVMSLVEEREVVPSQYLQKTPRQAIRLAEDRKRDYFRRKQR